MKEDIELTVNGRTVTVAAHPEQRLLDVLRGELMLLGVRETCGMGMCGTCTVLVDGTQLSSCLVLVGQVAGRSIETVESMAPEGSLHTIQQAFVDHNAFQCSYCTPGFLIATQALLAEESAPTAEEVREYLAGNLCRCGSYVKIQEAVLDAAERLRADAPTDRITQSP